LTSHFEFDRIVVVARTAGSDAMSLDHRVAYCPRSVGTNLAVCRCLSGLQG
jgi:hypothetical protein